MHAAPCRAATHAAVDAQRRELHLGGQLAHARGHAQVVADHEFRVRVEAVQFPDYVRLRVVLARDAGDGIAGLDAMMRDAHAFVRRQLLHAFAEQVGRVGRHQQPVRTGGIGRPAVERGVQRVELIVGNAREIGCELHVDLAEGVDTREIRLVRHRAELDPVVLRREEQAGHREQLRHVRAGFLRQSRADREEIGSEARRRIGAHGAFDIGLAAVVRGDREQPVVELIVQELQVIECGAGRFDDIAPAVVPPVLLQAEARPRGRNELPEPRGPRARIGIRFERALDHREQREFERHLP
ncbi:MAG: hypothetical protein CMLOHMNK_01645 [Steroidobacteraceae bacterium]|nr:hypothetical protein [Steroidobacteraceae bacterium]